MRNDILVSEDDPLERCIATLGEPTAHYDINLASTWTKFILGSCLFVGGLAAIFLFFTFGPAQLGGVLAKLLFVPPVIGLILLFHLVRTRGLHVLVYPSGIFRFQRSEFESYPWAEIDEVRFKGDASNLLLLKDDVLNVEQCVIQLTMPRFTIWGTQLILKRKDGVSCKMSAVLENFDELTETVQLETFAPLWPGLWASFNEGKSINFGIIDINQEGISRKKSKLPWAEVRSVRIENKMLVIRQDRKWSSLWGQYELSTVPNPHLFLMLLHAIGVRITDEEE